MLTVLIRYKVTRTEVVQQVKSVEFYPGSRGKGCPLAGLLLVFSDDESTHLSMTPEGDEDYRDVFVMNAQGQTVARYTL